jgi:hypothetical protein
MDIIGCAPFNSQNHPDLRARTMPLRIPAFPKSPMPSSPKITPSPPYKFLFKLRNHGSISMGCLAGRSFRVWAGAAGRSLLFWPCARPSLLVSAFGARVVVGGIEAHGLHARSRSRARVRGVAEDTAPGAISVEVGPLRWGNICTLVQCLPVAVLNGSSQAAIYRIIRLN